MSLLKLKTDEHMLTVVEKPLLTTGNENIDRIEVEFDSTWEGMSKVGVFKNEKNKTSYALFVGGGADIPADVLLDCEELKIGIVGVGAASQITSRLITYDIEKGAILEDIPDPDEDIYLQILSAYAIAEQHIYEIDKKFEKTALINDSDISQKNTYSSNKIEQLISLMNYKKAIEKEKVVKSSGYYALYQISNIVIMIFNKYFTGGTSGYVAIDYTENIDVPSYSSTQGISGGSVIIEQGSRTIKLPTNVELSGNVIFIVDSTSEEGGDTITELIDKVTDISDFINKINTIPSAYIQKNILINSGATTTNNGIQYVVKEDGSIIANGTATSDSIFWINNDLKIDNQMDVLISGCTEGSATSYFFQVGNPTFTPLNIRNINGENAATLLANTSYVARIVIKSGQIVNNLVFKPMIRRKNEVNPEFVPYVNDLCTRIIAIENNQKYIG